jgi:hypothetical protein
MTTGESDDDGIDKESILMPRKFDPDNRTPTLDFNAFGSRWENK